MKSFMEFVMPPLVIVILFYSFAVAPIWALCVSLDPTYPNGCEYHMIADYAPTRVFVCEFFRRRWK